MNGRRIHLIVTAVLALALSGVIALSIHERGEARSQLQLKAQEASALRRRAETAEANEKLVVERFAGVMKAFANEAGNLSGKSLAKHEKSFVQVYGFYRAHGKNMATAGTACYLGGGYFLTVKHVVIQEGEGDNPPPTTTKIAIRLNGEMLPVKLVDSGNGQQHDSIDVDDWAVLFTPKPTDGLVPVRPSPGYSFAFGERLVRYGNDSNRGIAVAAGYVAQVSDNGWISWLVDSLPGCSGGGVLNGKDELVGLNGGFLDGNNRLAILIPIRSEMFRKVPKEFAAAHAQ